MKVLFLTIVNELDNKTSSNIYSDLIQEFIKNGNEIYAVSSIERKEKVHTHIQKDGNLTMLKVKTGNIQKTNFIEKGISTLMLEHQFIYAIKKYLGNIKFDIILYATPPITFCNVIKYIKKRDKAITYLMLKDIFPQNAVDLGIFKKKGIIFKYFRKKEIDLYKNSDFIGCMSEANVSYVLNNNKFLNKKIVHLLPNAFALKEIKRDIDYEKIYRKYNIPKDAMIFIYGGNLGRPQGIDFLISCLKSNNNKKDRFFIICGKGTDYYKLDNFMKEYKPKNILLINGLPKNEFEELLLISNVGMIFLDFRFTIPNFPSRLLSYLEYSLPVLSVTDINTDIGTIIENGNFGWKCESDNESKFNKMIDDICKEDKNNLKVYGNNGNKYMREHYTSEICYNIIKDNINKK